MIRSVLRAPSCSRDSVSRVPRASWAAITVALGILTLTGTANAFCRSTTCRAQGGKECPTDGDGCPTDGAKLWWPTSCISYATNKLGTQDLDPADTRPVIRKTFEAWT